MLSLLRKKCAILHMHPIRLNCRKMHYELILALAQNQLTGDLSNELNFQSLTQAGALTPFFLKSYLLGKPFKQKCIFFLI